ncbi:MAG TPA: helix-turn-helix domain-containing protein [Anaerolineales bacterium]|nr:helix-turn-helix domain-containing protein [Anaerolineales bacterium]
MTVFTPSKINPHDDTMPDLAEFMTTQEAAEKLGFHVKSIPKMVRDNVLEGVRFGRAWLVSRKSVDEYIKKTKGMSRRDPRRKVSK